MARLKKLQRNVRLREHTKNRSSGNKKSDLHNNNQYDNNNGKNRSSNSRCTILNCLACLCLVLNVLVLSLSMMINRRLKEDAGLSSSSIPPSNNNNAVVVGDGGGGGGGGANLRGNTQQETNPAGSNAVASTTTTAAGGGGGGKNKYHIVFTSDCKDPTQDWQVYVFFFHIAKSGQAGEVTHIVTGCQNSGSRRSTLEEFHKKNFDPLGRRRTDDGGSDGDGGGGATRFYLYFAPVHPQQESVGLLRTHMKYFNRPYGVKDWMEKKLGYSPTTSPNNPHDDTVIVLMDVDMILMKPFGETFNNQEITWKKPFGGQVSGAGPISVVPGFPVAQHVPFPSNWWVDQSVSINSLSTDIQGGLNELKSMSIYDLDAHYSAGPPFMVSGKDFYPLVHKWNEITHPLYQVYTEKVLREPHAPYALAAAILKKPHRLAVTFSVSNYRDNAFGIFMQAFQEGPTAATGVGGGTGAQCRNFPQHLIPHVLQYSKRYALGNFIIGKHYVHQKFLGQNPESCQQPLFAEPPDNAADLFDYYRDPEINQQQVKIDTKQHIHTMTYMVCETLHAFNEAASHYKRGNCPEGQANYAKTLTFD